MSHPRRFRPKPPNRSVGDMGACPDCGKLRYPDRKTARTVARRAFPGEQPSAYRCGDYWHWGHLPTVVRAGTLDRDVYRGRPVEVETDTQS